jgi:5,10-methylenetetrahydromethanopterin reductase
MEISCAFATSLDTPEHIELAEKLGFARAWCYDSPAIYPDVWMTLALAAKRTHRIGLGPGVLIPHLRHVMTTASAIGTLEALAPGRVMVAVGAGFTGRRAMGQKPLAWKDIQSYVVALKALLRGEDVEWEGTNIKMLHLDRFAPPRPIDIKMIFAASGPRGMAAANAVADGLIGVSNPTTEEQKRFPHIVQMATGTVLDPGEAVTAARVLEAAGHTGALMFHGAYERGGNFDAMPGLAEYSKEIDDLPERSRHLAVHEGHLVTLNAIDKKYVTGEQLARMGTASDVAAWQQRLRESEATGVTEVAYQPGGYDVPRELRAFAEMANLKARS